MYTSAVNGFCAEASSRITLCRVRITVWEKGFGQCGRCHRCRSERDLDRLPVKSGLRFDLLRVAPGENEQATLGAGVLDHDSHERLDELAEFDLARQCLRSLDYRPDIQLIDGRADRRWRSRGRFLVQPRVAVVELSQLAEGPP